MPTIHEFNNLFGQTPELPPLKPRKNPVAHQKGSSAKSASEAEKQPINPHTEMSLFSRIRNSALLLLYPRSAQAQGNRQGSRPQTWRPNPFQALKLGKKMVVVASVDSGMISFFRFGQGSFDEWPMA